MKDDGPVRQHHKFCSVTKSHHVNWKVPTLLEEITLDTLLSVSLFGLFLITLPCLIVGGSNKQGGRHSRKS